MRFALLVALSLLSAAAPFPKESVEPPPPAPLPDRVIQAKSVMLTSEVGGLVYDEAYKCLQKWGRYQLTGDAQKADLIITLQSGVSVRPPRVRDILFPYPYPYPVPPYNQNLWLVVIDAKTNQQLWAEGQFVRSAFKEKNRRKDTILAVDELFRQLQERLPKR